MFNKEKEFELIEEKLNEIRIACNRMQIPFIWIAAVKDDGALTQYKVAVDENDAPDLDVKKYPCHALVPGSMGIALKDDKIRDIIKVLNGFKVVANNAPPINSDEFSYSALFPEKNDLYEFDKTEGSIVVRQDKTVDREGSTEKPIVLNMSAASVLPKIKEDFE